MIGYGPSIVLKEPNIGKIIARKRDAISKIAVLVIILIISFGILTSPGISPISSIRDTDGDGVPDSFDSNPLNSSVWNQAYAKIIVSITNLDQVHNMSFYLYLDGAFNTSWEIPALKTAIIILPVSWQYGNNASMAYAVSIAYNSEDPLDRTHPPVDSRTIIILPNYSVAMSSAY